MKVRGKIERESLHTCLDEVLFSRTSTTLEGEQEVVTGIHQYNRVHA